MSFTIISIFLGITLFSSSAQSATTDGLCDTFIKTQGYACEEHTVITKDGYILNVARIPEGRSGGISGKGTPILLHHGLLSDGATWLVLPPDQALAFVLADNGFDVWVANSRGSIYSHGHTSLKPDDPNYWNWSWDELSAYDLPAMFHYIYTKTQQKLHYVGHSQGTLIALAALSKDKSLIKLWRSASLLAPLAYVGKMPSKVTRAAAESVIGNVTFWLDLHEFKPLGEAALRLIFDACRKVRCNVKDLLSDIGGKNCCLNSSAVMTMLTHQDSTATKNLIHFAQMVTRGTLAMYDYDDEKENRKEYGQATPPAYNLKNIPLDFPLSIFHGGADAFCDVKDVKLLLDEIMYQKRKNLLVELIPEYAHGDFVSGTNTKQKVYDPILHFLKLN